MRVPEAAAVTALLAWLAGPAVAQVVIPPPGTQSPDRPPDLAPPGDAMPPQPEVPPIPEARPGEPVPPPATETPPPATEPVPPGAEPAPLPDAPPEVIEEGAPGSQSLTDTLAPTGGVLRPPPGIDPEMVQEPPGVAVPMPVIPVPPPDSPQPNPDLAPE